MKKRNDGWLSKAQASNRLGVSVRTLERYAKKGRVVSGKRETKFGPVAVYDIASLDTFKEEQKHDTSDVVLDEPKPMTALVRRGDEPLTQLLEALRTAFSQAPPSSVLPQLTSDVPPVPIADKLSLTLKEASALSGYSRGFLLEQIHKGKLKAAKRGRGWNVKRPELDAWFKKLP